MQIFDINVEEKAELICCIVAALERIRLQGERLQVPNSCVIFMTYLHGNCIFMLRFLLCSVTTKVEEEADLHINRLHGR